MGCDIHLHVEVKLDGEWRHYNHPDIKRNYALFAKMADVRNHSNSDIVAISPPRGVPDDATFTTAHDAKQWGTDGHSHSYLNVEDIAELSAWGRDRPDAELCWLEAQFGFLFGNSFTGFLKYPEEYPLEDVRIVFWFDN